MNDEEFMNAKPAPAVMPDSEFIDAKPAQAPAIDLNDPVNAKLVSQSPAGSLANAAQGTWYTRPFEAAGIAIKNATSEQGKLGLSDESVQSLEKLGVLGYHQDSYTNFIKAVNGAVILPAAYGLDALNRGVNAGVTGALALGGGFVSEAERALGGGTDVTPSSTAEEAQFNANALYMMSGMTAEGAVTKLEKGAAPTLKEVMSAPVIDTESKVISETTPVMGAENKVISETTPAIDTENKIEPANGGSTTPSKIELPEQPQLPVLTTPAKSPFIDSESGNLNLDYIKMDSNAKELLSTTAQAYAEEEGIVISHSQTVEESQKFLDDALKETSDGIPESLANYMRGDPANRPMLYAARKLTVQVAKDAFEAVVNAAKTGAQSDVLTALDADDRLMTITGIRHEISAEAGRVLESHKIDITDSDYEAAAEKLSGMTPEERIRVMSTFDSPEAIAKFARDIKKPSFTDMGIFYVINNYLSGPITHAAYAASWGAQTCIRVGLETPVASAVGRIQKALGKTLSPEEIAKLTELRSSLTKKIADADAGLIRLKPKDSLEAQTLIKKINDSLNNSATVMPGEAKARMFGIGQGALDAIRATGRALKTGNIQMLPGELAKAKAAAKEAVDAAMAEGKSAQEAQKAGEAAYNKNAIYSNNPILDRAAFIDNPIQKKLMQAAGLITGVPTRAIAGIHTFQKFSGYAESLNALVYRRALSEGLTDSESIGARIAQLKADTPPDIIKQAADEAQYAALMGKPGAFGQSVENLAHVNSWTRMVVPFSRVVTNLANQKFLERTPAGLLSPEIRSALMGEKGNAAQANTIAKMLTGSTLLAGGAYLTAQGINNGQIRDIEGKNPAAVRARAYLAGTPPYTIRIGDMNIPHRFFGVAAGSLSLGADVHDIMQTARSEDDAWSIMGNSIHVLGTDMLQENALKGAADLYDAIRNNDQNAAESYVLNAVSAAATPYSVGMSQVTRNLDPIMRSTAGNDFWERLKKTEEAHIPWESSSLLPKVDIFGNPMERDTDYEKAIKDPVMQALMKIDIYPAPPATRIMNVKLNDQQYYDYATKAGRLFYQNTSEMVQDPSWQNMDVKTQADMIHRAQKDARANARSYLCLKYPDISDKCNKYNIDLTGGSSEE